MGVGTCAIPEPRLRQRRACSTHVNHVNMYYTIIRRTHLGGSRVAGKT